MEEDLQRVASATGASVQTTVNNVIPDVSTGGPVSYSSNTKLIFFHFIHEIRKYGLIHNQMKFDSFRVEPCV